MVHRASLSLIPALLLCACFNPDYSDGHFLCVYGGCPDGYGCVHNGTTWICKEGVPNAPRDDAGAGDQRTDGPAGDGFVPPKELVTCSIKELKEFDGVTLKVDPTSWDLTLDELDNPYLVYVNDMNAVLVHYISSKSWIHDTVVSGVDGPVAATIDGQLRLHVAHTVGGRAAATYAVVTSIKDNLWTTVDLYNKNKVVDLDIGAQPRGTSIPWYILYARPSTGTAHHVVEGRMSFASPNYGPGTPCARMPNMASHPVVSVAYDDTQNNEWAATSFFGTQHSTDPKGWKVARYAAGTGTGSCANQKSMDCACPDHAGRMAVHTDGNVHLAHSRTNSTRGGLLYTRWNGASLFSEQPIVSEPAVDPKSLDIDVDAKGRPCVSFFATGPAGVAMLRVACLKDTASTDWRYSNAIEKVVGLSYAKMEKDHATATRIAIGKRKSSDKIHVAFTTPKGAGRISLKYLTCALP